MKYYKESSVGLDRKKINAVCNIQYKFFKIQGVIIEKVFGLKCQKYRIIVVFGSYKGNS